MFANITTTAANAATGIVMDGLHMAIKQDKPSALKVWLIATLFVTIVSCCSLIGVSIMPLISGESYKIFITLFTGLAVGSLVGSAIFSLIPQAFNLQVVNDDRTHLYKALVIFIGIYLFYCSERVMRLYFERRTRRREKRKLRKRQLSNAESPLSLENIQNQDRYNRTSDNGVDISDPASPENATGNELAGKSLGKIAKKSEKIDKSVEKGQHVEKKLSPSDQVHLHHLQHHHHHHHHAGHTGLSVQEEIVNKLREEKSHTSGDGGADGRLSPQKHRQEIAPVAWMIIIGDGLHNFIDGLSIGAAFSESIFFGVSTSVAVICEEFPHELGDFAVLISSGMSVRQALFYNFLSACTCYLGMIVGIILGNDSTTQNASYIFALAGGMFLYIALVDMMGELSAAIDDVPNQSPGETVKLLIMQNIGILTGITVIFLLSMIDVSNEGKNSKLIPGTNETQAPAMTTL